MKRKVEFEISLKYVYFLHLEIKLLNLIFYVSLLIFMSLIVYLRFCVFGFFCKKS